MNPNFVVMGLPASGKTTFLAALWHIIEADEVDCRLKLDHYEGDLKYLNGIAEAWRTFKRVPRTSQVGDKDVAIHFIDAQTNAKGRAVFPDLAGETFDVQVESRRCRPNFIRNVEADDGILLFISADSRQDSLSIVELNSMMPSEDGGPVASATDDGESKSLTANPSLDLGEGAQVSGASKPGEWLPKKVPGQVRIVQLLSDMLRPPFALRMRRLVVILSAWDVVSSTKLTPEQWLAANMPLVDQFLRTNAEYFTFQIYGVSAQGVSLDDKDAVDRAAKMTSSRRISIVGQTERSHDITAPLVWLISTT